MVIGKIICCWRKELPINSDQKVFVFSDSVLCLGGKCPDHLAAARIWKNDHIKDFVGRPEYRPCYDITGNSVELVWKMYVGKKRRSKSSNAPRRCWKKRRFNGLGSRTGSSCQCTTIHVGENTKIKAHVATLQRVPPSSLKSANQDNCHFLILEMKKNGTEAHSTNHMDNGTREPKV